MRKISLSFEELVKENVEELLNDPVALNKIEQRIDERQSKRFVQNKTRDKKLTASNS